MSREKKTRPSVGALGRAVETGSAMQADTTSKPQFTPNGPGGQRKVADLLSHGRENAIPPPGAGEVDGPGRAHGAPDDRAGAA